MYTFTQSIMKGIWERKKKNWDDPPGPALLPQSKTENDCVGAEWTYFLVIQGFKNWT